VEEPSAAVFTVVPEDRNNAFLRKVLKYLPCHTASQTEETAVFQLRFFCLISVSLSFTLCFFSGTVPKSTNWRHIYPSVRKQLEWFLMRCLYNIREFV
jgi:hypothetical protein